MKLSYVLLLVFFISCSSSRHQNIAYQSLEGKLKDETLMMGNSKKSMSSLASCYNGEMNKFEKEMHALFIKDPKDWRYWAMMGNCSLWRNQIREAIFFLKTSASLTTNASDKATVFSNLAIGYVRLGRYHKALQATEEAFKTLSGSRVVAFNLAQLYLFLNENQKALELLSELQSTSGEEPEIWHFLGLAYLKKGSLPEATKYLGRIPANMQDREDIGLTMAEWKIAQGDWENAEKYLSKRRSSNFLGLEARAKELKKRAEDLKNRKRYGP
jgi:predicted Zn-dependent protease